jgi:hypothetical protein
LLATFSSVRRYTSRANVRLTTVNVVRQMLNDIYNNVRADTWDGYVPANLTSNIDNRAYTANYTDSGTVGLGGGQTSNYRSVTVQVGFPDAH